MWIRGFVVDSIRNEFRSVGWSRDYVLSIVLSVMFFKLRIVFVIKLVFKGCGINGRINEGVKLVRRF